MSEASTRMYRCRVGPKRRSAVTPGDTAGPVRPAPKGQEDTR